VDGTAEEHLRIGALEDAGDAGAPLELLLPPVFFNPNVCALCCLLAACCLLQPLEMALWAQTPAHA